VKNKTYAFSWCVYSIEQINGDLSGDLSVGVLANNKEFNGTFIQELKDVPTI